MSTTHNPHATFPTILCRMFLYRYRFLMSIHFINEPLGKWTQLLIIFNPLYEWSANGRGRSVGRACGFVHHTPGALRRPVGISNASLMLVTRHTGPSPLDNFGVSASKTQRCVTLVVSAGSSCTRGTPPPFSNDDIFAISARMSAPSSAMRECSARGSVPCLICRRRPEFIMQKQRM